MSQQELYEKILPQIMPKLLQNRKVQRDTKKIAIIEPFQHIIAIWLREALKKLSERYVAGRAY